MSYRNAQSTADILSEGTPSLMDSSGNPVTLSPPPRVFAPPETTITLRDGSSMSLPSSWYVLTERGYLQVSSLLDSRTPVRLLSPRPTGPGFASSPPLQNPAALTASYSHTWNMTPPVTFLSTATALVKGSGVFASFSVVALPPTEIPASIRDVCACAIPDSGVECSGLGATQLPTPTIT